MSSLGEDASPTKLEPGTVLGGKFEIRGVLGEGGMGVVYDASQSDGLINRRVAIKVLHARALDAHARARFKREAQILAQLQHPHIVTMYEAGIDDDLAYLVFEHLFGRSLVAERGALEVGRVLKIAQQICRALTAAHAKGIVHRDLKRANVILVHVDRAEHVKLIDFGIARSLSREREGATRLTSLHQRIGTPRFMSPEQVRNADVDHRADLYALGCLLFDLLMGAPPFRAVGAQLFEQHLDQSPPRFCEVRPDITLDAAVENLVRRLLQKRPEYRYQSAAEVDEALESCAASAPTDGRVSITRPLPALEEDERAAIQGRATVSSDGSALGLRNDLTEPSSDFGIDDQEIDSVADSAVLAVTFEADDRASLDPAATRAERVSLPAAVPTSIAAPPRAQALDVPIHRTKMIPPWMSRVAVSVAGGLAVALVVVAFFRDPAVEPVVIATVAQPRAALSGNTDNAPTDIEAVVRELPSTVNAHSDSAIARDQATIEKKSAAKKTPVATPDLSIRLRNIKVESGRADPSSVESSLKARENAIARCHTSTQTGALAQRTLRLFFASSNGQQTLVVEPHDPKSDAFVECLRALKPPLELEKSSTPAIAIVSVDVAPVTKKGTP